MELHANDGRIELRAALPADRDAIESLLGKAGLPAREVDAHLENFLVATRHGQVLGCAGMELYGTTALLRSLAVEPEFRGIGLGRRLTGALLDQARRRGCVEAALLTSTAVELARSFGFGETPRELLPQAVRDSWEFSGACWNPLTLHSAELLTRFRSWRR
jgi:N-acetylglutamate synthase-like GNAT family acetyltransferase